MLEVLEKAKNYIEKSKKLTKICKVEYRFINNSIAKIIDDNIDSSYEEYLRQILKEWLIY